MTWDISTTRRVDSNRSKTLSARNCYPCLRNRVSPMSPEWTLGNLEAPPGFEPGMEVLQTSALPLGDGAGWKRSIGTGVVRPRLCAATTATERRQERHVIPLARHPQPAGASEGWSGKRDSNPRLRPWQGRTLPLSYSRPRRNLSVPRRFAANQPYTVPTTEEYLSAVHEPL